MTPVLVVVDVQAGFVRAESEHVVPVIAALVDRWQAAGRAAVFTRYFNTPGSAFERLIGWSQMQYRSADTLIVPALRPFAGRATAVLDKDTYTSLTPEFLELAAGQGWTDVYVCGIATESCVLKTAVDAFEQGFTPWLLKDASASHAGCHVHDAGLLVASRFIGERQVITTAELWDRWPCEMPA